MALLPDPRHEEFLQWLTTIPEERTHKSLEAFGATQGVSRRTLHDWKARPEFRKEWDERAVAIAGDPERTQRVMDAMYSEALNAESSKQVQAARAWADMAGVIKPPKKETSAAAGLSALSTEDLEKLIAEVLADQGAGVVPR